MSDKLHLAHFSQGLDVNLTHINLSALMPLFADSSASLPSEKYETTSLRELQQSKVASLVGNEPEKSKCGNIFSDTSLFDDGTDQASSQADDDKGVETTNCAEKNLQESENKTASSSQDSTDTGFSESQVNGETGESRQAQSCEEHPEASSQAGSKRLRRKPSKGMWKV